MKIAIDVRTAASGEKAGKGWYTFHIVKNLLELDSKNQYFLYTKDPIPSFQDYPNAKIIPIKYPSIFWHLKAASHAKKHSIDIFFSPTSYITPALLNPQIKSILTVHDLVAFLFPTQHNKKATIIEKFCLKHALKKATAIAAVSENTKKDLIKKFHYPQEKIHVVPCSIASTQYKPIPKTTLKDFAQQTRLPEKFFLAIGTIEPRKNYLNLIKAFSFFSQNHPNYHLVIVGKKGWQYDQVFQEIRKNYLEKKVHILGYLSTKSIAGLYNLAQALVFPSLYEGFGMPPLEALNCGCPVITSKNSSLPEVVGDSALFADPQNPQSIADAMQKITKPDVAQKLSQDGLKQAKKFSWQTSAKKLLDLLKSQHE